MNGKTCRVHARAAGRPDSRGAVRGGLRIRPVRGGLRIRPLRGAPGRVTVADVRRVAWVLVGLSAGCWRENPAFFVELPATSTGPDAGSTSGAAGSSDDMPPGTGSSGDVGESTTAGPGTTAVDPGSTGAPMTTSTTGEPDTTGTTGPVDEEALCAKALAGDDTVEVLLIRELGLTMCEAQWRSSDLKDPNQLSDLKCPTDSEFGYLDYAPLIPISPDTVFGAAMLTGPRTSLTGTIEGLFPPTALGAAEHPCLITRLGCPLELKSCSLMVQISVRVAGQPEFDAPLVEVAIDEGGPKPVAIPLTDFKGESVEILLVAANDGQGEGNPERVAWELPWIVEVSPK